MMSRHLRADAGAGLETRRYMPDLIRVSLDGADLLSEIALLPSVVFDTGEEVGFVLSGCIFGPSGQVKQFAAPELSRVLFEQRPTWRLRLVRFECRHFGF